jgi:hypothetical protein
MYAIHEWFLVDCLFLFLSSFLNLPNSGSDTNIVFANFKSMQVGATTNYKKMALNFAAGLF